MAPTIGEAGVSGARPSPLVFVVGCPRSGTTLLQRMLDHHPLLSVANDTHFIPKVVDPEGDDVPLTPELVRRVLAYHRFGRLGLPPEEVWRAAGASRTYAGFVSELYDRFARGHGKPFGGEKTPDYVRHLPFLGRLFPWARFIHLVRDGRDVALSALEWAGPKKGPGRFSLWREDPLAVCALWWRWQVMAGRSDGRALGSRYLEIRYEDLVAKPADAIDRACVHLGLPGSTEPLRFHVGRERAGRVLSAKSAWLPPTPGLREWRREMSDEDVGIFELLAGDALTTFGYERVTSALSARRIAQAERYRNWWTAEQERRRSKRRMAVR